MLGRNRNYRYLNITKNKNKIFTYKKEVIGVLLIAFSIILFLSLFSYNPTDRSWFYFASKSTKVLNWCGVVGANLSAFSFYLFGSAAYIFLFLLLFFAYTLLFKKSFKQEWDRLLALFLLLFSCTALLRSFDWDFTHGYPGGLLGDNLLKLFSSFMGSVGTRIILFTMIWISLIIFFRVSFFKALRKTSEFIFDISKVVGKFLFRILKVVLRTLWDLIVKFFKFLWKKIRGLFRRGNGAGGSGENPSTLRQAQGEREEQQDKAIEDTQDEDIWSLLQNADPSRRSQSLASQGDRINQKDNFFQAVHPEEPYEALAKYGVSKDHGERVNKFKNKLVLNKKTQKQLGKFDILMLPNSCLSKNIFDQNVIEKLYEFKNLENQNVIEKIKKPVIEFDLPDLNMFQENKSRKTNEKELQQECIRRGEKLEEKLGHFGIKGQVTAIRPGPVITLFEYKPEIDSKISKIIALEDDLAMAVNALSIRIVAPIPGRSVVGFEISNQSRQNVYLSDILLSEEFENLDSRLPLALGFNIVGKPVIEDLVSMPHLLVAGSTGSGKSVGLNAMLVGMLCKLRPDQLKLILIDPKRLEFAPYSDIPHLLFPIVTNPRKAAPVLKWLVQEMEERYDKMAEVGVRSIIEYQKLSQTSDEHQNMPLIVLMIDELADLMMVAGKEVEVQIARIAQMARAAGIHMVVATQRPSVDVVTGLIKVNFPSRIAYRVSSKIDSRTILDSQGSEKLLGRGDMLYMNSGSSDLKRVHGAYVSDREIEKLTTHLKSQGKAEYLDLNEALQKINRADLEEFEDEIYPEVLEFLKKIDEISISMLQRQYRIGFNRSARIIERLEFDGVLAPAQGSKPRKVIKEDF